MTVPFSSPRALRITSLGATRPGQIAATLAGLLLLAAVAPAQDATRNPPAHARLASFERFYAGADADTKRGGQLLLGELNCVACHVADAPAARDISPKQAPLLDQVGKRVRPEYIRDFLLDPQSVKPGTTMPHVLTAGTDAERQSQADSLVHFLALTGTLVEGATASPSVKRGETLFHQIGCVACHDRQQPGAAPSSDSLPLGVLSRKYSRPSLQQFLADPLAVRPSGRMPHLNLTADESRDIASYLLRDQAVAENLRYAYYEGTWDKLPDFTSLQPTTSGTTSGFAVNLGRPDNFAVRFEGFLQIAQEGQYQFRLGSDDGSRLRVDGAEVVQVDGIHPLSFATGRVALKAGAHKLEVEYFEQGGGEELQVEIEGPGVPRQSLDFFVTLDAQPPAAVKSKQFVVDPSKAEQGGRLFQKLGCFACHALGKNAPTPALATLPQLNQLNPDRGCLAATSSPGVPRFALSKRQAESLREALVAVRGGDVPATTPADVIDRTLTTFNCYACHQRGKRGGVTETRNASFLSNQPEMGDEGRIPPQLTGVGAKLRKEWLEHVFQNGAKDRPYMFTRMPKFGVANVGHLVAELSKADPEPPYQRVVPTVADGVLKATGRKLVGAQGFSCIKCHTWGNVPATGIQSIGMTTMTRRLREPWFHAYILDPPAFRAGTRMPAAWPMGQTLLPNVLGGDARQQIHSVWAFLADGDKAAMPLGLGRDPIELVAHAEPVMYRNFLEGAGPRAIGVGYPQKVNLAFDANDLRLSLLWQGSFIDASKHWTDRGAGFQSPLGDNVLKLPAGVEFATLDNDAAEWPMQSARKLGGQFRGYRLDARREPVFLYDVGTVRVEDHPRPIGPSESGRVVRSLTLTTLGDPTRLWFRAAAGAKIESMNDGTFHVDGQWQVKVTAPDSSPVVRTSGNRRELLVPLAIGKSPLTLIQEILW